MPKDEKEKLVPNLRFKGFTDDWIQRKIKKLSEDSIGGGTPSTKIKKYWDGDIPWIQSSDIQSNNLFDVNPTKFITEKALENSSAKVIKKDTITIVTRVGVGKVAYIPFDFVTSQDFLSLQNFQADPIFGTYLIYLLMKKLALQTQGTSIKGVTKKQLLNNRVFLPEESTEQRMIGSVLRILDKTITLEQEKLAHYHAMKKALSTSIFPKNNESLPNLTFNGDSGWKQQKLEDFLSIPDKIKVEVTDTDEILSVKLNTNGVVGGESRSTLKLGATTYYRRYSGQFIYGKQNFFNGAMAIIPEALNYKVSSGDIPSLNISNINPIFLYEYLSRPYYYKQTEAMASGTGSKRIHEKTLLNFKIKVPNNDIQDNIEQLFTNLTALLDSQNNKVNKMIQIKKVLLNNLFV